MLPNGTSIRYGRNNRKNNDIVGWYYKDGDAEIDFVFGENGTVVKDSMTIYAKLSLRDYNDGTVFTLKEDNTYAITGYTGDDADVIIPVKYKGLAVTEISANAFKDNQTIKSIKIASSIKLSEMMRLTDAPSCRQSK